MSLNPQRLRPDSWAAGRAVAEQSPREEAPTYRNEATGALEKYNLDEPRDWRGRWTTGNGAGPDPVRTPSPKPAARGDDGAPRPPHRRKLRVVRPAKAGAKPQLISQDHSWREPSHLWGGRLTPVAGGGIGDNEPPPEPEILPEAEPRLEAPRAPVGWTVPGYTVGGLYYPPTRYPKLPNGKSWPIATPEAIKSILQHERGKLPEMVIFVPLDRVGPTLIGSDNVQEYRIPSGYSEVKLFGTPQVTRNNSGVETNHARNGILEALRLAETDEFKDIFFNRSFSVATRGVVKSVIRPDVTAIPRPSLNSQYSVHPYESLSPGQTKEEREEKMPNVPGIARLRAEHYKLLRLLMKYYLAHRIGHR